MNTLNPRMLKIALLSLFSISSLFMVGGSYAGQSNHESHTSHHQDDISGHDDKANNPKNIILFIVDGMGLEHVKLGNLANGEKLKFEKFPHKNTVTTHSADGTTDSAAGATAIATGRKVSNGVLSVAIPGDGSDLETVLEKYQAQGKSVGLVTNTYIDDATPAAFAAHTNNRSNFCGIWNDYFTKTKPNLILGHNYDIATDTCPGDDGNKNIKQIAEDNGYTVVQGLSELQNVSTNTNQLLGIFGLHNSIPGVFPDADYIFPFTEGPLSITEQAYYADNDIPRLEQMIQSAIKILSNNPKGYFLMVENSHPDRVGHTHLMYDNDILCAFDILCLNPPSSQKILEVEMLAINKQIEMILNSIHNSNDTLLVVTSDHETGGIRVLDTEPVEITWDGDCAGGFGEGFEYCDHTSSDVGIWARGKNSDLFKPSTAGSPMDNTQIAEKLLAK